MSRHWSHPVGRFAGLLTRARRLPARKSLALAIAVPLAAAGLAFAAAGSANAAAAANQPICHATGAAGKYVPESPNIDATGLSGGHTGHARDIIPPFPYTDKSGVLQHFAGQNWTATGQAIFNNGCDTPNAIDPIDPTPTQANCVAGAPTPPALTLPTTPAGVTYSASPAGPYTAGQPVTVTATNTVKTQWFQAPAPTGWTFVDVGTETYQLTFRAAPPCGAGAPTVVDPVAPTVVDAACAAGVLTPPTLTLASSPAGVSYAASAAPAAGTSLTVTATVTDPALYTFMAPGTGGWAFVDSGHETYPVTFAAAPPCGGGGGGGGPAGGGAAGPSTVTPVAPTFGDPGCRAGGATAPFVTTPGTPGGVTYSVSPAGPYAGGQKITVTATVTDPAEQFAAPGTGGWTFVDATHETITHTFAAAPSCSGVGGLKVVSATPSFVDAVCVDGAPTTPSYTLPDLDGVRYAVDGRHRAAGTYPAVSGSTITVRMTATAGFTLRDDAPAVHRFPSSPQCLGVEPVSTSTDPLANTGAPVVPMTVIGALVTMLGAVLMIAARRRDKNAL